MYKFSPVCSHQWLRSRSLQWPESSVLHWDAGSVHGPYMVHIWSCVHWKDGFDVVTWGKATCEQNTFQMCKILGSSLKDVQYANLVPEDSNMIEITEQFLTFRRKYSSKWLSSWSVNHNGGWHAETSCVALCVGDELKCSFNISGLQLIHFFYAYL